MIFRDVRVVERRIGSTRGRGVVFYAIPCLKVLYFVDYPFRLERLCKIIEDRNW